MAAFKDSVQLGPCWLLVYQKIYFTCFRNQLLVSYCLIYVWEGPYPWPSPEILCSFSFLWELLGTKPSAPFQIKSSWDLFIIIENSSLLLKAVGWLNKTLWANVGSLLANTASAVRLWFFFYICIIGIYNGLISPLLWVNYQWFTVGAQSLTVKLCGCLGFDQANFTVFLLMGIKQLLLSSEMADRTIRVWGAQREGMEVDKSLMFFLSSCRIHLFGKIWGYFELNFPHCWQILSNSLDLFFWGEAGRGHVFDSFIGWKCKSLLLFMNVAFSSEGEHVFLCFMFVTT